MNNFFAVKDKKHTVLLVRAGLILLPLLFFLAGGAGQVQQGNFSWTMGLQNVKSGELVSFSAPVQSWTGEQFRLIISPGTDCYAYVIYEGSDGEQATVLYAGIIKSGEAWYSEILEVDANEGAESLFIVTSKNEQTALAQGIRAFASNPGTTQRRAMMNEIFRIRSEVSQYKETPEKPVLMGGAARGTPDKNQGVEFAGSPTYVKTISIEH